MLILYITFSGIAICAYCFLIIYILNEWDKINVFINLENKQDPIPLGISIVIAARNEENNIVQCIESILNNSIIQELLPQIIIVDDHSTDRTAQLVSKIKSPLVELVQLNIDNSVDTHQMNAYKKAAINLGIDHCKHDFIIQFDADTIIPKEYLKTIIKYQNHLNAEFLAGPISFSHCHNLLHHFQQLDLLGMMAVTGVGIYSKKWHIANGANMCYAKKHFKYHPTDIASGDDVYTIQKVAAEAIDHIYFIKNKDAIIKTAPVNTWTDLYHQRVRWASKNKSMQGISMQVMMLIPFINSLLLLMHLPMAMFFGYSVFVLLLFHIILKLMIDYIYLDELSQYFDERKSMKYFLPSFLIHILYISGIGLMSLFIKKYKWKGRYVH